jgi:hypothetical protein
MKHVNASVNEIDEIMGSPSFQIEFDSGLKDDDSKEPLNKPLTLDEVLKQKKEVKNQCLGTYFSHG